jgi:hypothetical protein
MDPLKPISQGRFGLRNVGVGLVEQSDDPLLADGFFIADAPVRLFLVIAVICSVTRSFSTPLTFIASIIVAAVSADDIAGNSAKHALSKRICP